MCVSILADPHGCFVLVKKTLRLHGLHNFEYFHLQVFPHTTLQGLDDFGDPVLNLGPSDLIMINKQETSSR